MIKLHDTAGNTIELNLERDIEKVSLAQGLGFQLMAQNIDDWLIKEVNDKTLDQDRNHYLYMMAEAVSAYTGADVNSMLGWNVTDLLDENGELFDSVIEAHLKKERIDKNGDDIENLLLYLFNEIADVMAQYDFKVVPGDYTFEHGGKKYKVPNLIKSLVMGKEVYDKVTIGQTVDIMKTKKYIRSVSGYQENIERKKDITFTAYLQIISILAIEEGKEYPDTPEAATAFVQEQAIKFKDIGYCYANDIVFFLTTIGPDLKRTPITSIISNLLIMRSVTTSGVGMRRLGKERATTQ